MSSMMNHPETFEELFSNGMKRKLPMLMESPAGMTSINLGAGNAPISGACNLDLPEWAAPSLEQFDTNGVGTVHAYHFFEHLSYFELYMMLCEIERVLCVGGVCNYCVPYAMSQIAYMDASHRTFWGEDTMRTILSPRGYDSSSGIPRSLTGELNLFYQVIAGVRGDNLAIVGQLIKGDAAWE